MARDLLSIYLKQETYLCKFILILLAVALGLLAYFPLAFDVIPVGSKHHLITSQVRPCLPLGSQVDPPYPLPHIESDAPCPSRQKTKSPEMVMAELLIY